MSQQVDTEVLEQKMRDMDTPGAQVEFDPDEADEMGYFTEDALSPEDAIEAAQDGPWED